MASTGGKGEVQTAFWCSDVRKSDQVEDTGVNMKIRVSWILRKSADTAWLD